MRYRKCFGKISIWNLLCLMLLVAYTLGILEISTNPKYNRSRFQKLLDSSRSGDAKELRHLIEDGADIHYRDGYHTTALMMASVHGHTSCVQILLDNGADVNERSRLEKTPLMHAAASGHLETVKLLLANNADVSLVDTDGKTAPDFAMENGHNKIVIELHQHIAFN